MKTKIKKQTKTEKKQKKLSIVYTELRVTL